MNLRNCPSCKSERIIWLFGIATDGSKPITSKSKCGQCGYQDERGGFERTNKALLREEKINKLLG